MLSLYIDVDVNFSGTKKLSRLLESNVKLKPIYLTRSK